MGGGGRPPGEGKKPYKQHNQKDGKGLPGDTVKGEEKGHPNSAIKGERKERSLKLYNQRREKGHSNSTIKGEKKPPREGKRSPKQHNQGREKATKRGETVNQTAQSRERKGHQERGNGHPNSTIKGEKRPPREGKRSPKQHNQGREKATKRGETVTQTAQSRAEKII